MFGLVPAEVLPPEDPDPGARFYSETTQQLLKRRRSRAVLSHQAKWRVKDNLDFEH